MQEVCENHMSLAADLAVLKNDIGYIRASLDQDRISIKEHIADGEKEGGFRDRLRLLEEMVARNEKIKWVRLLAASIIGGLSARLAPDALWAIVNGLLKAVCNK